MSLHGKGFAPLLEEGDVVTTGDPLIHWDLTPARDAALSPCVPIVVVSPPGLAATPDARGGQVSVLDPIFSIEDPA